MSGFAFLAQLDRKARVRLAVLVVAACVVAAMVPLQRKLRAMDRAVAAARVDYLDTLEQTRRYKALMDSAGNAASVVLKEPLFSYVQKTIGGHKLNNRIDYVRPEDSMREDGSTVEVVHVAFKGITLHEFVRFLYGLEVQKREIFVKTITITKDDAKNLNVQMTLQRAG
ncbi:MAG: hypothetical protein AB7D57_07810 [Desulfovibrionaceae bacterium]